MSSGRDREVPATCSVLTSVLQRSTVDFFFSHFSWGHCDIIQTHLPSPFVGTDSASASGSFYVEHA